MELPCGGCLSPWLVTDIWEPQKVPVNSREKTDALLSILGDIWIFER